MTLLSRMDIYNEHFGLKERPFSLSPDPSYLFWSSAHSQAFSMLEYCLLTYSPITLITGDPGTGKTTLIRHLIRSAYEDVRVAVFSSFRGKSGEFLQWVMISLGLGAPNDLPYPELHMRLSNFLKEEYENGRRVVLVVDEAQNLGIEALEELWGLTNLNHGKDCRIQFILAGLPEFQKTLHEYGNASLMQRISVNFHVPVMDKNDVRTYISHRLAKAGAVQGVFSTAASDLVAEITRGVPRLVNQLCDITLLYTYTQGYQMVPRLTVQKVLDDGLFSANRIRRPVWL